MNVSDTLALITDSFSEYGENILSILGLFIEIGIGYLIFRYGTKKIKQALDEKDRREVWDEYYKEI